MEQMRRPSPPLTLGLLLLAVMTSAAVPSDSGEHSSPPRVHDPNDPHPAATPLADTGALVEPAFTEAPPVMAPPSENAQSTARAAHRALERARKGLPAYPKVVEAIGKGGAVATGHPLATAAALRALKAGGTAVDAAVAAALTLGVAEPYHAGLGGGGFAVVYRAGGTDAESFDFRERAPFATPTDGSRITKRRRGCSAVAIPGVAAGLWAMHQGGGRLAWQSLFDDAISAAEDGVVVGGLMAARIKERGEALRGDEDAAAIYLPRGVPLHQGDTLRQPQLALSMRLLAAEGPAAFYGGPISQGIVEGCKDKGGLMTDADFQAYRVRVGPALQATYGDRTLLTVGPPSIGGLQVLQLFRLAQHLPLQAPYGRPQNMHLLAEAMRISFAERTLHGSDGERAEVPVGLFVDDKTAVLAASRISAGKRIPLEELQGEGPVDGGTTHISVVDAEGNAVALTMTINFRFGAAVVGRGTGVLLNDTMDDFSAPPGESNLYYLSDGPLNTPAPGAAPLSSMSPLVVLRNGKPELILGGVGGPMIPTSVAQVLVNRLMHGMPLRPAVGVPRIHHQLLPDRVAFEGSHLMEDARAFLAARGHTLYSVRNIGTIYAVEVAADGTRTAVADVRSHGAAAVEDPAP
jgi:gamma-glutamyltranspeptidase/glutathione hydrolase